MTYKFTIHGTEWNPEEYRNSIEDLIEEIGYHFSCYNRATDKSNEAYHFNKLADSIGDLKTWHQGYDSDNGTLPWEREDGVV